MSFMLDLLCVGAIAVFVVFGFKKGIITSIISLVGTVVATVISMVLSSPIATAIYNGGMKAALIQKMEENLKLSRELSSGDPSADILKSLPGFVAKSMPSFKVSTPGFAGALAKGPEIAEEMLRPIIISFMSIFVSIFLFIILLVVLKIVIKIISASLDNTGLSIIDRFVGGLIGLLEGFAIVILVAFIVRISIPHLEHVPKLIQQDVISESYVFNGVYNSPYMIDLVKGTTESPNIK